MSEAQEGQFGKSMSHFSWYWFAAAVLQIYHENEAMYEIQETPFKPRADSWAWDEDLSTDFNRRVRQHWCKLTGLDHTYYPYGINGVRRMFFRIRKRKKEEIQAFDQEVENAIRKMQRPGENQRDLFDS